MEWIFLIVVSMVTGYQAGKAGVKAEARDNKGYCMMEMDSSEGCYEVVKVQDLEQAKFIKAQEDK